MQLYDDLALRVWSKGLLFFGRLFYKRWNKLPIVDSAVSANDGEYYITIERDTEARP